MPLKRTIRGGWHRTLRIQDREVLRPSFSWTLSLHLDPCRPLCPMVLASAKQNQQLVRRWSPSGGLHWEASEGQPQVPIMPKESRPLRTFSCCASSDDGFLGRAVSDIGNEDTIQAQKDRLSPSKHRQDRETECNAPQTLCIRLNNTDCLAGRNRGSRIVADVAV